MTTLQINGKDIGEVKDVEYTIGVDLAKDSTDATIVAFQEFSKAAAQVGVAAMEISGVMKAKLKNINRLVKELFPDSLYAKGYKIVNHRGRNKLVKL